MRMTRVTSSMLSKNYTRNAQRNLSNMQTLQTQLSTGKLYSKPSDNPLKVSKVMGLYSDISANTQYNQNIKDASSWLDTTDSVLGEVNNLLSRVRELMVSVGNGSYNDEARKSIQTEMSQKVNELSQLLNTNYDGAYIFGGTKSQSKPVTVDGDGKIQFADKDGNTLLPITEGNKKITDIMKDGNSLLIKYTAPAATAGDPDVVTTLTVNPNGTDTLETLMTNALTGAGFSSTTADKAFKTFNVDLTQIGSGLDVEISQGVTVDYNKTAIDILQFKDKNGNVKNVSDIFNEIINNLNADGTTNPDGTVADHTKVFGDLLGDMDCIVDNLLSARSDIGVISNRMKSAKNANEAVAENLTTVLANTEDVDYAEKIMEYSVLQTVYQASIQVSAKILPVTILDYL